MRIPAEEHPVILFDGVCNLCNGFVQFVIRRDSQGLFRFASLQSPAGAELLRQHGLQTDQLSTMVVVIGDRTFVRSDAALEVCSRLSWPWKWLAMLKALPSGLRNRGYDFLARNRYRFFGKRESCLLPTPELRKRFL